MASNTPGADINEIHLGFILNGGNWTGGIAAAKDTYDKRIASVKEEEKIWRIGQTYAMAEEFLKKAAQLGYSGGVKDVHWTARQGFNFQAINENYEAESKQNPSDLLIEFNRSTNIDSNLGLSAKSIQSPTGQAPFKNKGMKEIQSELLKGTQLTDFITEQTNTFLRQHPNLSSNANTRKNQVKALSETMQKDISGYANTYVYPRLQDILINGLRSAGDIDVKYYILNNLYDTIKLPRYIKVTGRGTKPPYNAVVSDPLSSSDFKALISNDRISYEKIGNTSVGIKISSNKLFKIRFKYESISMSSTMKLSVEFW